MANYSSLKNALAQVIKPNDNQEITGQIMQDALMAMINALGAGYQFAGVPTAQTDPSTPDQNVFYIAGAGTYPNFGATKVPQGSIGVFRYNGSWDYSVLDVASWADASNKLYYNTQAGNVAAKTIQADGFTLQPGGWLKVHFDNANTVDNPTLNVNNTGAHSMTFNGRPVSATNSWKAGETVAFYYDNYGVGIWRGIRLVELPDFVNVNDLVGQSTPFASASAARSAIPQQNRKAGLNIAYLLSTGEETSQWQLDMFIGDDVTDWGVADNWKVVGPVTVTQNTETGHTVINIGDNSYPVASVEEVGEKIYDEDLVFAGIGNKTLNLGIEPNDQIVFQMSSVSDINVKVSEVLPGSVTNALVTITDSDYHIVTISPNASTQLIFTKLNSGGQTIHIKVYKNNPNASIKGLLTKDNEQVAEINNTKELVNARTNGFLNQPTTASAKKVIELVSNVFFFNENNPGGIYYWKTLMKPSLTLAYFMIWDGTTTFLFQIDGERSGKTTYNLTANDHPEVHCQFTVDWSIGFISPLQDTTLDLAIISNPYGEFLKEYVDGQKFEKVNPRSVFTSYQAQVLTDLNDALPNTKYMLTIDATHKPANLPTDYPVNPADNALLETITTIAYPGLQVKYQTIRSFQLGGYHYYRSYSSNYGWTAWTTVSDLPIYEIGSGKKYTTLRAGIEAATKVRNADVYIYAGTYDLTQEFATELADSSYNHSFGLFLKNGVKLHFLAGSYVKAIVDMSGGDDVRILNWFSPFEIHGNFEIDGLNIEAQNTRYCVHDDTDGNEVLGTYRNCVMVNHTTSTSQYAHGQCIGGGIVVHKHITIDNCVFTASKAGDANIPAVFYHNGTGAIDDSKIFVKDCYFADNNQLGVYSYGQSQIISYMYACGNSLSNAEDIFAEKLNQDQPYDNMDVVAWNNEFRDNL